jgi:hypothetical protein
MLEKAMSFGRAKAIRDSKSNSKLAAKQNETRNSLFHLHSKIDKVDNSSSVKAKAKRLGLTYLGFGRYGTKADGKTSVTHIVKAGVLHPFQGAGEPNPIIQTRLKNHDSNTKPLSDISQTSNKLHSKFNDGELDAETLTKEYMSDSKDPLSGGKHLKVLVKTQKEKLAQESEACRKALAHVAKDYQNGKGFEHVNAYVYSRGKEPPVAFHKSVPQKTACLDSMFDKEFAKIPHAMNVYTGTKVEGTAKKKDIIGMKSFVSVSGDLKTAFSIGGGGEEGDGGDVLQISLKPKDKAVALDAIHAAVPPTFKSDKKTPFDPEDLPPVVDDEGPGNEPQASGEMLLPRNSQFIVKDGPLELPNGKRLWHVEVAPAQTGVVKQSDITRAQREIANLKKNK